MNKSTIEGMKLRMEDVIKSLDVFFTEVQGLSVQEKQLDNRREVLSQRKAELLNREVTVKERESGLNVKKSELVELENKVREIKATTRVKIEKLEGKKAETRKIEEDVHEKTAKLVDLQEREKELVPAVLTSNSVVAESAPMLIGVSSSVEDVPIIVVILF